MYFPYTSDEIGGANIYGLMLMAQALGSVIGATCAPYLRLENVRLGRLYSVAYIISGIASIGCIFTPWSWLSILVYGLAWVPGGAVNVIINTSCAEEGCSRQFWVWFSPRRWL